MIYLLEKLRRASATVADEQISALLRDAAKEIEQYEEEARDCNQKMEDSDWCRQYREACIKIAEQHEELERLRALVANGLHERPGADALTHGQHDQHPHCRALRRVLLHAVVSRLAENK